MVGSIYIIVSITILLQYYYEKTVKKFSCVYKNTFVLGVSLKGGRQCIIVSITIKYSILLQYHSITMKRHRNFVVFTKTHLCAWSINEGWLAVMTPSGEKTPPQQQNWQRGERGIHGNENINKNQQ